ESQKSRAEYTRAATAANTLNVICGAGCIYDPRTMNSKEPQLILDNRTTHRSRRIFIRAQISVVREIFQELTGGPGICPGCDTCKGQYRASSGPKFWNVELHAEFAMECIRTTLGNSVNNAAGGAAEFRFESTALDLDFRHSLI